MQKQSKHLFFWLTMAIIFVFIIILGIALINKAIKPPAAVHETPPVREMRGAWMSRFEYTQNLKTHDQDSIKAYIAETFEHMRRANFNTIFFQVRGNGDALYNSANEPWSNLLTGTLGQDPGWDPLAYAVTLARRLGLEIHAWINTFPVWRGKSDPAQTTPPSPYLAHPEWLVCDSSGTPMPKSNHYVSFSPGIPAVHDYIIRVVTDIVEKYDIDGIHFDYIRYPEGSINYGYSHDPISVRRFRSTEGNPHQLNWQDWQREQLTQFVARTYNALIALKPYLKVSAAVIGKYNQSGWNGYHQVFQDARRWSEIEKIDWIIPMLYMGRDEGRYGFTYLINEWQEKFSVDRPVYAGLGIYRIPWEESLEEIEDCRKINMQGNVIFSTGSIKEDNFNSLKLSKYQNPAKIPSLSWKDTLAPPPPSKIKVDRDDLGVTLKWSYSALDSLANKPSHFIVYRSREKPIDTHNSDHILTILSPEIYQYFDECYAEDAAGWYYTVTVLDAAENESRIKEVVYVDLKDL